jgi:arylsulfatase A-like enzyme/Tfp pilus assembly protein PilF
MTTRTWAGGLVVCLAAAAAIWWTQRAPAYELIQQPDQNVLLVTIDTLRADALSGYGGRAATPNLDRLAASGARFTFAHAHAVVTLPSHTSILTGQLPYEHGIRDNSGFRVKTGTPTLATRLKGQGFATAAFIGGFPLTRRFGLAPGFDVYDDQISELTGDAAGTVPERPADVVVARALEWITARPGKFFSWVHVFDPHSPYTPPEAFLAQHPERPYDGEVAWTDHALGPLFEKLGTLSHPTLVVVTSDHGESLGEHGEATHGLFAYEATLRVPLIVATIFPGGKVFRGRVIDTPVRHVDIAPTILDAVAAPVENAGTGASLRALILEGQGADRPAYFESMTHNLGRGWAPLRGVLVARDKYVDQPIPELYDLRTDPGELRNAAASNADRRQVLEGVLRTFNTAPADRPGRETAAVAATLRSLGYTSGGAPEKTRYTEADDLKNLVSIDRDLHRAGDLAQAGRRPEAMQILQGVIDRRPDTTDAHVSLARLHWNAGDAVAAVGTLEHALKTGVTHEEIRLRLGLYLAESRIDVTRAITLLSGLPEDDAEVVNSLGVAYGAAGRYADAIQVFERVLVLDPSSGLALQNIAAMYLEQNNVEDAERFARRAAATDPALGKAQTTLGVVLARTGRKADAIDAWKRAVALDGTEFDAMYNLVVTLLDAGRAGEARTYATRFVATAPASYQTEIAQLRAFIGR